MPEKKIRVAVLMGGESAEREISEKSGKQVLAGLDPNRYLPIGVLIDEKGRWAFLEPGKLDYDPNLLEGFLVPGRAMDMLLHFKADIAFLALHGPFGEDGTVQGMFEIHHFPYTGSGVTASALAMSKPLARAVLRDAGLRVAPGVSFSRREWAERGGAWLRDRIEEDLPGPWFVKPSALGSSVGVCKAGNFAELESAVENALRLGTSALVEQAIEGAEVTCAVLGNSDGALQALPPIEIVPRKDGFFTYEEKYDAQGASEICPPKNISPAAVEKVREIALKAHRALGCDGMSRVDMIVAKESIYVLELNTIPGLTERSLLPQAAAAAGISFPALLDRLIQLGFARFGKAGPAAGEET